MNKEIGQRIKRIRILKNVDAKNLADEIGIRNTSLSKIEREGTNSVSTLMKLAQALKVKPSDFFEEVPISLATEIKPDYGFVPREEFEALKKDVHQIKDILEILSDKLLGNAKATKTSAKVQKVYAKPRKKKRSG